MRPKANGADGARPLLIVGRPAEAGHLALRRILRAKERRQAVIVIDYRGSLAPQLTRRSIGNMSVAPTIWCDLSNRRRPIALFRFSQTPAMPKCLEAFLTDALADGTVGLSRGTLSAVTALANRLARSGHVGLLAILNALRRPEFAQPLRRSQCPSRELERVIARLEWLLRFPGVWAVSEGENTVDLVAALDAGATVWIEMDYTRMETKEHQAVAAMVDSAICHALMLHQASRSDANDGATDAAAVPMVLYAAPPRQPLPLRLAGKAAKHIGLFGSTSSASLPQAAKSWLEEGADLWVSRLTDGKQRAATIKWLTEAETQRVLSLGQGEIWVRSGTSLKSITTAIRVPDEPESVAAGIRNQAIRRLKRTAVDQFSTAAQPNDAGHSGAQMDLYSVIASKASLYAGWFRVQGHRRESRGSDGVTIEDFGRAVDVEIGRLAEELATSRYRARPLRTARIPKSDGDVRVLRIACVRDRVVQAASLHVIEPFLDVRFSPTSFAYRAGRSAHHALAIARAAIRGGRPFAVTADIRKCFDSIDHDILLRLLGDVVPDRELLRLVRQWLEADIIDFGELLPAELGIAQGEAISPILANLYLDPMDKEFERNGHTFVRYADDYLVLCATETDAQGALALMQDFLASALRLSLKPAKTMIRHASEGIGFLGFELLADDARIPLERVARIRDAVCMRVGSLALPPVAAGDKWHQVQNLNAFIRGIRGYFLLDGADEAQRQLQALDEDVLAGLQALDMSADALIELSASIEHFAPRKTHETSTNSGAAALAGTYAFDAAPTDAVIRSPASGVEASQPVQLESAIARETRSEGADADVVLVDGRVHVMTSGCFVSADADDLIIRRRKAELARVRLAEVSLVYLEGKGIGVSADLALHLCECDVPLVLTPLIGRPGAIVHSILGHRADVRQQQAMRRGEPEMLRAGLKMLAAKIANQASVLRYFARYRKRTEPSLFVELTSGADELRAIGDRLDTLDPSAAGVRSMGMGHEGRAAALYWSLVARLVPSNLQFPGRQTRHATDALNSAINYVYGLLYGEIWRSVVRIGLDPYFGIIHGKERDQGSLVFDMIEEFRAPFGDRVVLSLIGRGLDPQLDREGKLRVSVRRKLAAAFHRQLQRQVRWRTDARRAHQLFDLQATNLRAAFLGEDEYRPFRFQW